MLEDSHLTEYLTEQEQIELLKSWIKQYSLVIIAGVVMAGIAIFGWRTWQDRQIRILSHASAVYDEMLTARAQNNATATHVQAQKLFDHYANTTYGPFAALMLARDAIAAQHYSEAETHLQWAFKHGDSAAIRQIARLRLARLYIAEQKPSDSLALLDDTDDASFNGLSYEVKGDAYLAMNNKPAAREAYKQALESLPNAEVIRPLLQMKYDNLATTDQS
jgi:predicted negative regulator of RcsB-dependent stress response